MALPTITKTWNFDVNNASQGIPTSFPDAVARWQTTMLNIKNAMVAISPGWTVAGSGGAGSGGGGGIDAVDRWQVSTDIAITSGTTTGNGWIVLQNNSIRTGFQVLLQPVYTVSGWPGGLYMSVSPDGNFTGGTETSIPTATDEVIVRYNAINAGTFPETPTWHLMMSSDGECTRLAMHWGSITRAYLSWEVPANPVAGWTDPWFSVGCYNNFLVGVPRYEELAELTDFTRGRVGIIDMPLYHTSEGWDFNLIGSAAGQRMLFGNDLDGGAFPMSPVGLASETTGVRGRHGEVFDAWWGSNVIADNAHYPDTLPRQFVQLGRLIVPWDQSAGAILKV